MISYGQPALCTDNLNSDFNVMEHLIYKYCKMSRNLEKMIGESKRKLEQKLVSIVYY